MAAVIPRGLKKQSKSDSNLCDELVAEILVRLPTTSAVRFKVVCKRWYSLTSSPYFISNFIHKRHHRDVQSSLVLQIRYYCESEGCEEPLHSEFQIISHDYCSLLSNAYWDGVFRLSFLPYNAVLEASFGDLILCSSITSTYETNYYVSNLLTRQWIALPQPPPLPPHGGFGPFIGFLCVSPPCSECKPVDNAHYKFMVVRLYIGKPHLPYSRSKVQIFSSEDRQWRTLDVSLSPPTLDGHHLYTSLVAYRGMLHSLNTDCIVVYDPLNTPEKFSRIIHLPNQHRPIFQTLGKISWFGVCQGCLRVVEVSRDNPGMDVWELVDYDSGLWNLVHKVHLNDLTYNGLPITQSLHSNFFPLKVLSLHPKNENIVYLHIGDRVALVNMKTKIMEWHYYSIREDREFHLCWMNTFHLADQWWPTPVSLLPPH